MIIPPVSEWTFGSIVELHNNNAKSVPLFYKRAPISVVVQDAFVPFEPSNFKEDSTRQNLVLSLSEPYDSAFDCFEAALVHVVTQRRLAFFGETEENDIIDTYKAITRKQGEYPRGLRVKMSTSGLYSTRFWDEQKMRIDPPEKFVGARVKARVLLRAIWIGEDTWGIVADCTDLQVKPCDVLCPF